MQQHLSFQQIEALKAVTPACGVGKWKRRFEHQPYLCDSQRGVTTRQTRAGRRVRPSVARAAVVDACNPGTCSDRTSEPGVSGRKRAKCRPRRACHSVNRCSDLEI